MPGFDEKTASSLPPTAILPSPAQEIDAAGIRHQLERILANPLFRKSKRYPAFLRHIVERTLDGAGAELKERNIAVDIFGRDPTYDPTIDPVVRITAGEVRKRLAQYYQERGHENEIRIDLAAGGYLPEFSAVSTLPLGFEPAAPARVAEPRPRYPRWLPAGSAAILLFLVALAVVAAWHRPTVLDQFWRPVVVSSPDKIVLLCFGKSGRPPSGSQPWTGGESYLPWWDAETLARLAGMLQSQGAALQFVREDEAKFEDFQRTPAVLIGAFNDEWTIRLMEKMRFTFQREGAVNWVSDRDHPSNRDWKIEMNHDNQGKVVLTEDFAVISRVQNPRTQRITVTVAGLYGYGTLAAGQFLTDPNYIQAIARLAPRGWQNRNMQIVIRTEVIQNDAGPPSVVAAAFW